MQRELGFSQAELTGAFSLALLVAGVAGIGVGRYLDRHGPRALMTAGSVAGALLVLAWSRVEGLAAFYALWIGIGLVMATVLYEPAFVVLAKWFPGRTSGGERYGADARGGVVELHLPAARPGADRGPRVARRARHPRRGPRRGDRAAARDRAPRGRAPRARGARRADAGAVVRSTSFRRLAAAFFLASVAAFAMIVQAIPFLLERGHSAGFAAFAVGLMGAAQIPGRLCRRRPGAAAARGIPACSRSSRPASR